MKRCAALVLPLVLAGCSLHAPMEHLVVDQNTLLAKTTDEVMLANLLRAMNNEPMHFSLVQTFHGSASLTAGFTLGTTFSSNGVSQAIGQFVQPTALTNNTTTTTTTTTPGVNTISPQITGSYTETPSFDSTIIDSQNFFQGFLKPVSPETVGHFLYDNWSPRLLTYLLVGRFQLVAGYDYDQNGNPVDPDPPKKTGKHPLLRPKILIHQGDVVAYIDNAMFAREQSAGKIDSPMKDNPFLDVINHFKLTGITKTPQTNTALFPVRNVTVLSGVEKIDGNAYDMQDGVLNRMDGASPRLIVSRYNGEPMPKENFLLARQWSANQSASVSHPLPFYTVGAFRDGARFDHGTCPRVFTGKKIWECATYIPSNQIFTEEDVSAIDKFDDTHDLVELPIVVKGMVTTFHMRLVLKPVLRSPESVFFFVGEYLRQQAEGSQNQQPGDPAVERFLVSQDSPTSGCEHPAEADKALIMVTTTRPKHPLLSAELDGERYYIPDSHDACNGQSMKVLTLLEQLFYLQVSSSDKLGITPTVHIVP
jgi:hypothetical protein